MKMMNTILAKEEQGCLDFFELCHNPFPVSPEEENFYFSGHIDQILSEIIFGINARKGFMVLTGEVGLGKTTISRRIMNIIEKEGVETSLVFYTGVKDVELIREINRDFGLQAESLLFSDQMHLLYDFLVDRNRDKKNCAIIVDDAQNLDLKSLELLRMISNLETGGTKLVQILLVGQPELMVLLDSKELRQLKSRIFIRSEVKSLTPEELKDYLSFKLNLAGNRGQIRVQKTALSKIYKFSKGNFRQVNLLMDRCLYVAFLHDTKEITGKIVSEAYKDLHPKKLTLLNKPLIFASSVLLVLSLFGGIVYSGLNRYVPAISSIIGTDAISKSDKVRFKSEVTNLTSQTLDRNENTTENRLEVYPVIPESITSFLKGYKLIQYQTAFFEALKTDRIQEVSENIYQKTGFMLIRLDHVSSQVEKGFGILKYASSSENHPKFYLFWRPSIIVKKFYYYYNGKEILPLQEMMAKIGLYTAQMDGKVGKNLMLAVVGFQKQMGLSVTGYPDAETIFLLCREMESIKNDAG
jgi:general secretion pathway protein A